MKYSELGKIMLDNYTIEELQAGYDTADPYWVGKYALAFGDINEDGTLN